MYEPFVFQVVKEILGPLYKKENTGGHRQVRFASEIEEIHEIIKDSLDIQDVCGAATLNYIDRIVDCLLVDIKNPLELSKVEEFADSVLLNAFESSQSKIIQQHLKSVEMKRRFGEDLSKKLLNDAMKSIGKEKRRMSMVSDYCDRFMEMHIWPTVHCFDDVEAFANENCDKILRTSVIEAVKQTAHMNNVYQYSNDLSKQILDDSFEIVRQPHPEDSYTKQALAVADKMVKELFCEHSSQSKAPSVQTFSENFCSTVWNQVYSDSRLRSGGNSEQEYMSFVLHSSDTINSEDQTKHTTNSNTDSSNSSFLTVNRRDSCDTSSEALTPKSAIDESTWKKGLYQFADQLLYSLSHLAEEPRIPDFFIPADIGTLSSKVRRSGSCPHILRIPSTVYETPCTRRQSETLIRFSGGMNNFAESLASDIMLSSFLEF